MPSHRPLLVLPLLLAVLAGCAASQPALRPADLPEHLAESPIVLHWRIDRQPDRATAVGLVEIPQTPERVENVTVELQGFDAQGRVVSSAREFTSPKSFTGADPWPFRVGVRPAGTEERFAVRVFAVGWRRQMLGQ
jgi:hypothetical protein